MLEMQLLKVIIILLQLNNFHSKYNTLHSNEIIYNLCIALELIGIWCKLTPLKNIIYML